MSWAGGSHGNGSQTSNTKGPPSWDVIMEHRYSIADWEADIRRWEQGTELAPRQRSPAIVHALTGLPREIVRELPPDQMTNGMQVDLGDVQGNRCHSRSDLLLHRLCQKLARPQAATAVASMTALTAFSRRPDESIDEAITRVEFLVTKAVHPGQLNVGIPDIAWMLLHGLSIPPTQWAQYLAPTNGHLPANDHDFNALLMTQIQRQGHEDERDGSATTEQDHPAHWDRDTERVRTVVGITLGITLGSSAERQARRPTTTPTTIEMELYG